MTEDRIFKLANVQHFSLHGRVEPSNTYDQEKETLHIRDGH